MSDATTTSRVPRMHESWRGALAEAFAAPTMGELRAFLEQERAAGRPFHPPASMIFRAFDLTPLDEVRVVIVGQDPYHGPDQAMGLAFSVPAGVRTPPSLRNILAELRDDVGITTPRSGDLSAWSERGVLLLNTSLTVGSGAAGSHAGVGWEPFTDAAIRCVSERREGVVFLLWGRRAQAKRSLVDARRHLVLTAAHPSPLSASNGFFGCRHFSRANAWFAQRGEPPVDWSLDG